jgi:predicted AAA+ superfamily ATPase
MVRNLFQQLLKHLPQREFTIITGARQTGKSTLMQQLYEHCRTQLQQPAVMINLENKNILESLNVSPYNILSYLPKRNQRVVMFVDEIQYLQDPSNFLKLIYDELRSKIKIVATGSSAFYIDSTFKDSLAGRKRIFWLPTCSFDEYLALRNLTDLLDDLNRVKANADARSLHLDRLRQEWLEFVLYGGYPAVITENNRKEKMARLAEIRDAYLKRDVLESGAQNETAFYNLFRLLAAQSGNLLNVNELSTTLRIKNETVESYLYVLQKCFHVNLVKPFFRNLRKELTKMPKVYLFDSGMQNCMLNNFTPIDQRADKGMLWETVCYKLLCERYTPDDILYWRTADGNEVDFVMPYINTPQAIEVKYDQAFAKGAKYKKFTATYPDIPLSFRWMYPFDEDVLRACLP